MKTILLTGAAGSIGHFIIKKFYKKYRIICLDKDFKKLKLLKKEFKNILIFSCDLTKQNNVQKIIKKIIKEKIFINILINNAGKIYNEPIVKLSKGKFKSHSYINWKKTLNFNLNSTFLISSKIIEYLCNLRKESLIINISSLSSSGNVGQSAYSASKSAVETLTKIWSKELSNFNIRVVCIAPGFFKTKSTLISLKKNSIENIIENTPSKRMGSATEFVNALNFVINNKFFNGKVLRIDGGLDL